MKKKILIMALLMAPLSIFAQKFAHFNSADIIPNMKEYTTAMEEIQAMQKQYEDDMKLMQDELQKKSEEYQKEQANLLDNVRQRREQELNDLYTRLQQSYQDFALQRARVQHAARHGRRPELRRRLGLDGAVLRPARRQDPRRLLQGAQGRR